MAAALIRIRRGQVKAERIVAIAARTQVLEELQTVDDVIGLDRLDRHAFRGARRSQLVRHQWEPLAQRVDEAIELQRRMSFVQAALQAIAEQRAERLTVTNAFDEPERDADAGGRKIDSERTRSLSRGIAEKPGAQYRRARRLIQRGRENIAAVRRVPNQRRFTWLCGEYGCQIAFERYGREIKVLALEILQPAVSTQMDASSDLHGLADP